MVSDASRASSAADFKISRRAASAWVTASLARLILAPSVLRSSGDILPSVASSAEIEPFLPSAATRTASRAASSPAAAIWPRMVCSSVARSDTVLNLSCKRPLVVAATGPKRQAKSRKFRGGPSGIFEPVLSGVKPRGIRSRMMRCAPNPGWPVSPSFYRSPPIRRARRTLPGQIDPFRGYRCRAEQGSKLPEGDASASRPAGTKTAPG